MKSHRFDALARSLTRSRRAVVGGALGLGALTVPGWLDARKKRKRKKRKNRKKKHKHQEDKGKEVIFNEFGCVDVGGKCRGNDANCCSGICEGKKPKQGKKDKSTCIGHDESTCQPGQDVIECAGAAIVECITSTGADGACSTTTGNAAYCLFTGNCFPCSRDTDCEAVCGPGAACIPCARLCEEEPGGTACVGLSEESCTFPM